MMPMGEPANCTPMHCMACLRVGLGLTTRSSRCPCRSRTCVHGAGTWWPAVGDPRLDGLPGTGIGWVNRLLELARVLQPLCHPQHKLH